MGKSAGVIAKLLQRDDKRGYENVKKYHNFLTFRAISLIFHPFYVAL